MPRNASVYLADPSLIGSPLFERLGAESIEYLTRDEGAAGVRMEFPWGRIQMNFMPNDQLDEHLRGFERYARMVANPTRLTYLLSRIHHTRLCIGCVIEHDDEHEDDVIELLCMFVEEVRGLLFAYDSVFDFSGEALAGPAVECDDES